MKEGCHQNPRLADGITGCQSRKAGPRSSDLRFAEEVTEVQGAGVTSLRPPQAAWWGQERPGFPRSHRMVAPGVWSLREETELCRAAQGVCVGLRTNRHF